jgi:hypothetical protein
VIRATGALHEPAGEHDDQRRRERAEHRPGAEGGEHDQQHRLLAVQVPETAEDGRQHGGRQQVGRQDPGAARGAGSERVADLGQCRDDDRLEQCEGGAGEGEHRQDQSGATIGHEIAPVFGGFV